MRLLFFAEDSGAANMVGPTADAARRKGWTASLLATGPACTRLAQLGVAYDAVSNADEATSDLDRYAVAVVGTSENPQSIGLHLIKAARANGIRSVGLVDSSQDPASRFRGDSDAPLRFAPDALCVPDETTKSGFLRLGMSAAQIQVTGHPYLRMVRDWTPPEGVARSTLQEAAFPGLPRDDRPILLFAAEPFLSVSSDGGAQNPWRAFSAIGDRTDAVAHAAMSALAKLGRPFRTALRPHPRTSPHDLAHYATLFDVVTAQGSSLECVHAADRVIGLSSIILVEAALRERPTLSVVTSPDERGWLPSTANGATPVIHDPAALPAALERLLAGYAAPAQALAELVCDDAAERCLAVIQALAVSIER